MSKQNKLLKRFSSKPSDFTYEELKKLLFGFDYMENTLGRTSGSRIAFVNSKNKHIIRLHKPHPDNCLKRYQIDQIIESLKEQGVT